MNTCYLHFDCPYEHLRLLIHTLNHAGGLSCKLEGIIESPVRNGYRNKCEFSAGYSVEGKVTVGFLLGNFRYVLSSLKTCVFLSVMGKTNARSY